MSFKFMPPRFGQIPGGEGGVDQFTTAQQPETSGGPRSYGEPTSAGGKKTTTSQYREAKAGVSRGATSSKQAAVVGRAAEARANAAYAVLIGRVIAEQARRDLVANAKKNLDATDKTYAPTQYEDRKKKYIAEYGKQLLRLANSIGRVTVEERFYPGSFFDEQVVVKTLPVEYAELFRNPMVRNAAYDDFMSAIAKAQGSLGVDSAIVLNTKKFADAKHQEAIDDGGGKTGAKNLEKVTGAPASWEPVVIAAAKGEAFSRIESLTSADKVQEISPWLADAFRRRSSYKVLKTIVGNYVADRLGIPPLVIAAPATGETFAPGRTAVGPEMAEGGKVRELPAVDRASADKARQLREEAARQKANAAKEAREAQRKAQEAEAARQKAEAEGRAADEARLAKEKSDAEQAIRDAEAKAADAERRAREAEQRLRDASANTATGPSTSAGASGGGEVAPFTPSGPSVSPEPFVPSPTPSPAPALPPAPGEAAPVVVTDGEGGTAIVVPDASVAPIVPSVPAVKAASPVVLLLAAAAIGGGIWWFSRRRGE